MSHWHYCLPTGSVRIRIQSPWLVPRLFNITTHCKFIFNKKTIFPLSERHQSPRAQSTFSRTGGWHPLSQSFVRKGCLLWTSLPAPSLWGWVPQKTTLRLGFTRPEVLLRKCSGKPGKASRTEEGEKSSKGVIWAVQGKRTSAWSHRTPEEWDDPSELCPHDLRQEC